MKSRRRRKKIIENRIVKKILSVGFYIWIPIMIFLASIIFPLCIWYKKNIKVSLDAALFTLKSPMKGTNNVVVWDVVNAAIPGIVFAVFAIILIVVIETIIKKKSERNLIFIDTEERMKKIKKKFHTYVSTFTAIYLIASLFFANDKIEIMAYVKNQMSTTKIYQEKYIDPKKVEITKNSKVDIVYNDGRNMPDQCVKQASTKNLIYIYAESMENSYEKKSQGGIQREDFDLMKNLVNLAEENVSFSTNNKMRGIRNTTGTDYTFGSMFAATSGIPFKFPNMDNRVDKLKKFAQNVTTLGDILEKEGYYQEFMCGSDATFAGKRRYYQEHGNYDIYDYKTAKQKGDISKKYKAGWGFEDEKLFQYAKKELTRISKKDKPFNFTMLTSDTHFPVGYRCHLCGYTYVDKFHAKSVQDEKYAYGTTADIIKCTDDQLEDFVEWCKKQDFYNDTVIIIQGDHPRMDKYLVEKATPEERTVYNCIINSDLKPQLGQKNRQGTIMDMFPTTLAALGFEIKGDRLGLGTNLFSNKKTIAEEMGFDSFDNELSKYSNYYLQRFK